MAHRLLGFQHSFSHRLVWLSHERNGVLVEIETRLRFRTEHALSVADETEFKGLGFYFHRVGMRDYEFRIRGEAEVVTDAIDSTSHLIRRVITSEGNRCIIHKAEGRVLSRD